MITDIDTDIAYILLLIETRDQSSGALVSSPQGNTFTVKELVHMESNKYYSYKTDANTHTITD